MPSVAQLTCILPVLGLSTCLMPLEDQAKTAAPFLIQLINMARSERRPMGPSYGRQPAQILAAELPGLLVYCARPRSRCYVRADLSVRCECFADLSMRFAGAEVPFRCFTLVVLGSLGA